MWSEHLNGWRWFTLEVYFPLNNELLSTLSITSFGNFHRFNLLASFPAACWHFNCDILELCIGFSETARFRRQYSPRQLNFAILPFPYDCKHDRFFSLLVKKCLWLLLKDDITKKDKWFLYYTVHCIMGDKKVCWCWLRKWFVSMLEKNNKNWLNITD